MSFLPEELKRQTFPCPNCKQYISSEINVCKFCSLQITDDLKQSSIENELREKKTINLNRHKNTLIIGVALLVIGFFFLISTIVEINYSDNVSFNCLTPFLIIAGLIMIVKGLTGYRKEARKF